MVLGQHIPAEDSLNGVLSRTHNDTARVCLLLALAQLHRSGDAARQFMYANEALNSSRSVRWARGEMRAEEVLGECYIKVQAFPEAIRHFDRSLALARSLHNAAMERIGLQYEVHCYSNLPDTPAAALIQKRLLDLYLTTTNDPLAQFRQMETYAQLCSETGHFQEGIDWMGRALRIAEARFSGALRSDLAAECLNNSAPLFIRAGKVDSALAALRKAAAFARDTSNPGLAADIISSFCSVYAANGHTDSAILYGLEAFRLGKERGDAVAQQELARVLSSLYFAARQPDVALRYYILSDSIAALTNTSRQTLSDAHAIARINMEQQAGVQARERVAFEANKRKDRIVILASLLALAALLLLTGIIYRGLQQKQRANEIINRQAASLREQNEAIAAALGEKETLLKEMHHRVKNNLQLISSLAQLQARHAADANTKIALRAMQHRIQSIASVHSDLYEHNSEDKLKLASFVRDLFVRLSMAFEQGNKAARLANDIPADTVLPLRIVVILGLILNELITNSFKYAFSGTDEPCVRVSLSIYGDTWSLRYADNGPGLPDGGFDTAKGSLGLHLVRRMSDQLAGETVYAFEAGSTFTISFAYAGD